MCGAKTAGFSIAVQNPAPQGEKSPIDQDDHETGEFAVNAHHRGVCIDRRMYQAGVIRTPLTNFTFQVAYMNIYMQNHKDTGVSHQSWEIGDRREPVSRR